METREPTNNESVYWTKYVNQFTNSTGPKIKALVLLAKVGVAAQEKFATLTNTTFPVIDAETAASIAQLGQYGTILENQIQGVLLKKYAVKVDPDVGDIQIVAATAPEGDIMPSFSGFGVAPILIAAGIAAVTLLGGGFITLRIIETKAKSEALKITERLSKLDSEMLKQPEEQRKQWTEWKQITAKSAAAAANAIPGAKSLLEKFLGTKATGIMIAGVLAIAAAYFLIPTLRRN